jgi:hypothetical protein
MVKMNDKGEPYYNWVKCSELLAAYGYGKPAQPIEQSGSIEVVTLGADERRTAVEVLRTLASSESGDATTRH